MMIDIKAVAPKQSVQKRSKGEKVELLEINFQQCCICGTVINYEHTHYGVLKPHIHFYFDNVPIYRYIDLKLKDVHVDTANVVKTLGYKGISVEVENTICADHLIGRRNQGEKFNMQTLYDMHASKIDLPYTTNAQNIGAYLILSPGDITDLTGQDILFSNLLKNQLKAIEVSFRCRQRSDIYSDLSKIPSAVKDVAPHLLSDKSSKHADAAKVSLREKFEKKYLPEIKRWDGKDPADNVGFLRRQWLKCEMYEFAESLDEDEFLDFLYLLNFNLETGFILCVQFFLSHDKAFKVAEQIFYAVWDDPKGKMKNWQAKQAKKGRKAASVEEITSSLNIFRQVVTEVKLLTK